VEGPLDEEPEDEDRGLGDDPTELNEDMREFDGDGGHVEVARLPARCTRLSFVGVRLGRGATFRRFEVVVGINKVKGELGLGDRKG
jgi:hypothetical protein